MNNIIKFQDKPLKITTIDGKPCFTSVELATALTYSREDKVSRIYDRHKDEFSDDMTIIISENPKMGVSGNLQTKTRYFSPRGCHLIAMFARTPVAKEFRKWVLDVLEGYNKDSLGLVPVTSHVRSKPTGKKEITLSDKEHSAIGGIVKKCVTAAMRECLTPLLQQTPVKPAKDVPELERTVIEAVFEYGRRKSMSARISGILDGAMNHEIVEIMKHVKPVCK